MNSIKIAKTKYPILDIIKNRWSARAFSDKQINEATLNTIFEAASWAASANNEQPWQYMYAKHGSEGFQQLWSCLMPGNQPWTKQAAVLIVCIARKTFEATEKPNAHAMHDLGMANAHLLLQANHENIYGHAMAGFDKAKLIDTLKLAETKEPICMMALGYLAEADTLEEPFKTRELAPRTRKDLSEFIFKL